jgi:RNA polymerase sigma factor (sigma-70 family)
MVGDRNPSEIYYKVKEKLWWGMIQRVKAGDERAYVELFNEFRNILMRMAYDKRIVQTFGEENAKTEVECLFYDFIKHYPFTLSRIRYIPGLIKKAIYFRLMTLKLKKDQQAKLEEPAGLRLEEQAKAVGKSPLDFFTSEVEQALLEKECKEQIAEALQKLTVKEKQVVENIYYQDMSMSKVALKMGITKRYVATLSKHAHRKLRRLLKSNLVNN